MQPSDKDIFERDEEDSAGAHDYVDTSDNSLGLDKRIDRILKAVKSETVSNRKYSAKVTEPANQDKAHLRNKARDVKTASLKIDSRSEKEPTEYRRRIEKKYDDYINKITSSEGKFKSYKDEAAIELKPLRSTVIAF